MECVFCHSDTDIYIPFGKIAVCPRCAAVTEIRKLVNIGAVSYVGADFIESNSIIVDEKESIVTESEIVADSRTAYTSYFSNLKNVPPYCVPIAICRKPPKNWDGVTYYKLAPPVDVLSAYKKDGDEKRYTNDYNECVLSVLNPDEVWDELLTISNGNPFVLLCYEGHGKFCHRHLVSEWLKKAGYNIAEW